MAEVLIYGPNASENTTAPGKDIGGLEYCLPSASLGNMGYIAAGTRTRLLGGITLWGSRATGDLCSGSGKCPVPPSRAVPLFTS